MRNRFIFAFLLIVGSFIFAWYIQEGYKSSKSLVGKTAPDFSLKNENGKEVSLGDSNGKVRLIHFWATWCPPCVREMPHLDKLVKKMKGRPFELIAISEDESLDDVKKFREQVSFSFPILYDEGEKLSYTYGVFGLPESFLVNKQGIVVRKITGPQDWMSASWLSEIEELMSE